MSLPSAPAAPQAPSGALTPIHAIIGHLIGQDHCGSVNVMHVDGVYRVSAWLWVKKDWIKGFSPDPLTAYNDMYAKIRDIIK